MSHTILLATEENFYHPTVAILRIHYIMRTYPPSYQRRCGASWKDSERKHIPPPCHHLLDNTLSWLQTKSNITLLVRRVGVPSLDYLTNADIYPLTHDSILFLIHWLSDGPRGTLHSSRNTPPISYPHHGVVSKTIASASISRKPRPTVFTHLLQRTPLIRMHMRRLLYLNGTPHFPCSTLVESHAAI